MNKNARPLVASIFRRTIITALTALIAMPGQAQIQNNYTISGNIAAVMNKGPYTVKVDSVEIHNDSTTIIPAGQQMKRYAVEDGKILISGRIEKPLYSNLMVKMDITFENGQSRTSTQDFPFILEAGNIVMDSEQPLFRGTPLNDACFEAMTKFSELAESEQFGELKRFAKDFINQHKDDPAAIYMIEETRGLLQPKDLLALIDQCGEDVQNSLNILFMKNMLLEECKAPQEGDKFKDFAVEYEGKTTRLSDYVGQGKYVLTDFWASWCGPCRKEIPNLIAAYNKYKNNGLQVIGIAAWDKPEDTEKAIAEEKIPYPQIINSQKIATDVYGIKGIPEIILFAPDGTILARGLRGDEIEKKLAEIFPDD